MNAFLQRMFLDNTVESWIIAAGTALGVFAVLKIAVRWLHRRVAAVVSKTTSKVDDVLADVFGRTKSFFLLGVGAYLGARTLEFPEELWVAFTRVIVVIGLIQSGLWVGALVRSLLETYRREQLADDPAAATTVGAMTFLLRLAVWAVVLVLALDNLGVDITALITGLGIGGIAIALAVQNVLGDLFASLSIVLDKPFVIGDTLAIDEHIGKVEHVGLKSTRIRSLAGEQLVFSNSDLLKSRIRNFGRLFERRMVFTIGVTYQTARNKLERIPTMLREIIERQERTRFDRAHFRTYADSSLNFEAVYYVTVPEFVVAMDIQQAVNLEIYRRFEEEGIEFAYPTRTLYVVGQPAPAGS
jgi:small-conductance mechanosensitive channel